MIGFDSFTVKQEHVAENSWRTIMVLSILTTACAAEAECAVCHTPLGPVMIDNNHHATINDEEIGDDVVHYCEKHCPACNGD